MVLVRLRNVDPETQAVFVRHEVLTDIFPPIARIRPVQVQDDVATLKAHGIHNLPHQNAIIFAFVSLLGRLAEPAVLGKRQADHIGMPVAKCNHHGFEDVALAVARPFHRRGIHTRAVPALAPALFCNSFPTTLSDSGLVARGASWAAQRASTHPALASAILRRFMALSHLGSRPSPGVVALRRASDSPQNQARVASAKSKRVRHGNPYSMGAGFLGDQAQIDVGIVKIDRRRNRMVA